MKSFQVQSGRVAIWTTPLVGDIFDPFNNPQNNLGVVDFCSDWDYYVPATGFPQTVSQTHVALTADPGTTVGNVTSYNSIVETDYILAAHNLGIEPNFMVSVNGVQYPAGCPIQIGAYGARRTICFWVDTTNIYVRDSGRPSINGLPAITMSYFVTVFRDSGAVAGHPLMDINLPAGTAEFGFGRVMSTDNPMREAAAGETQYALPSGETMQILNGRARFALPDGTIIDIGPAVGLNCYNGSFYGGPSKKVALL